MRDQLQTERLLLRPFALEDAPAHHRAVYGDPDVMIYMPGSVARSLEATGQVIESFIAHWAQHGFGAWAVIARTDNRLIGQCGLSHLPDGEVELFYALAKPYWGQGYTTEAARAALRYGFEVAGLDKIAALAVPENLASRRVMEKLGMSYRGISTGYYDAELAYYVLRREDFTAFARD